MSTTEQAEDRCVFRGGGWAYLPAYARVASRSMYEPVVRSGDVGVRLVRRRSALERLAEALRGVSDGQEG